MLRILVTGGAGFIGSHVVDALLQKGCKVLVVDNFSTGVRAHIQAHIDKNTATEDQEKSFTLVEGSLLEDEVLGQIHSFSPDAIVHLAAQMNVRRSVERPQFDAEQNIIATIRLLELARELRKEKGSTLQFIFASTGGAIYGEQNVFPADELHPTQPECPYGISKRSVEYYMDWYARTYGLHCTALRFSNVFGPRQNPKGEAGVVAIFLEKLLSEEDLVVNGSGEQTRDFIYVSDIVDAILRCVGMELGASHVNQVFNLGTGVETSVNEIAQSLIKMFPDVVENTKTTSSAITHGPVAKGEQLRSVLDASKFSSQFSWEPQVSIEEGLKKSLVYLREARSLKGGA